MNIKPIQIPATNYSIGRGTYKPEAIVLHIMDGSLIGTDSWFADEKSRVSAHYGIGKSGEVHQYVNEVDTAFHAGVVDKPTWKLLKPGKNPNDYTIGIEHEGQPLVNDVWPDAMKKASAKLVYEIAQRWSIPLDREHVIGHYEIRGSKPNCPAVNKAIIDEVIMLAKQESIYGSAGGNGQMAVDMKRAAALMDEAKSIINKYA